MEIVFFFKIWKIKLSPKMTINIDISMKATFCTPRTGKVYISPILGYISCFGDDLISQKNLKNTICGAVG